MKSPFWSDVRTHAISDKHFSHGWHIRHFGTLALGGFLWKVFSGAGFREGLMLAGLFVFMGLIWHFYYRFATAYRKTQTP